MAESIPGLEIAIYVLIQLKNQLGTVLFFKFYREAFLNKSATSYDYNSRHNYYKNYKRLEKRYFLLL